MNVRTILAFVCLIAIAFVSCPSISANDEQDSRREMSGFAQLVSSKLRWKKGIALDVGSGDGSLAIEVASQTALNVHCVDEEWDAVQQIRRNVDDAGLGLRVVAHHGDLQRLAYPSLSANLVICGDQFVHGLRGRNAGELYRVLSPNGVAVIGQSAAAAKLGNALTVAQLEQWLKAAKLTTYEIVEQDGIWAVITRPPSPGWDEWTHRNHDPANTLASQDRIPYSTYRPQWVSDYRPGLASAGIALADGRVVVAGLSYPEHPDTTPFIQVLDAFTGVELWAKVGKAQLPIDRPPGMYSNREFCSDYAVVGDTLYLLGGRFCHVIDLEDGEILKSLTIPAQAEPAPDDVWLYVSSVGDALFAGVGSSPKVKVDWNTMNYRGRSKAVFALDRVSGQQMWLKQTAASTASLTVADDRLYFCDDGLNLHAIDAGTGEELWAQPTGLPTGSVVAGCAFYRDKLWVLYVRPIGDRRGGKLGEAELLRQGHNRRELVAFSAENGSRLFDCDFGMTVAGFTFSGDTVYGVHQHSNGLAAVDVGTGKHKWKQPRWRLKCTASLATPNCLVYRSTETSVLDLKAMEESVGSSARTISFGGFRPTCTFAAVPANGMLYIQAPGCRCPSPIRGSMAMRPGDPPTPIENEGRLVQGESFDRAVDTVETTERIWASWRADRRRSGQTTEQLKLPLTLSWSHGSLGRLTPLCAGYGLLFCGSDHGKVIALDVSTGKKEWQYFAGTAIQAAPYLWDGRLYVGDEDGWVHCLRADDGSCIWRFRAALANDRTVGYGRYASLWPVAGGVLVHDGVAHCAAGLLPSEGAVAYALDAQTGKLKWQEVADDNKRNYRFAHIPGGAMAMSDQRLYIPTKQAAPWQIDLSSSERISSTSKPTLFGSRRGGPEIMVAGDKIISVAQGRQYVWHVKYVAEDTSQRLPIISGDTAYFLNQKVSGADGACLVAVNAVMGDDSKQETRLLWKAWPGEAMHTMIKAGDVLLTAGDDRLYATNAKDGSQLWTAPLFSDATDLAIYGGRLFVACGSEGVFCFEASSPSD